MEDYFFELLTTQIKHVYLLRISSRFFPKKSKNFLFFSRKRLNFPSKVSHQLLESLTLKLVLIFFFL